MRLDVAPSTEELPLFTFSGGEVGGFADRRYSVWALPTAEGLLTVVLDTPATDGEAPRRLGEEVLASLAFG